MAAERTLYAKEERHWRQAIDYPFLFLLLTLLTVGLVMLYSASSAQSQYDTSYTDSTRYLQKQAACALIGLAAMVVLSRIPADFWYKTAWPLYGISIGLLLMVLLFGQSVNGAKRWINIAGLQFQPSEIAKFTMILLFARLTKGFGDSAREFRYGVLGFSAALLGILVPLALEKHLSAIMLMGMVAVVMMFVAGTHPKWLLTGAAAAVIFVVVYVSFMGYAGDRITAWRYPELDPSDTGYQILQSLYAIGSGGLFGLGFGNSKQKHMYIPEPQNDFVFAVVCEELGFARAILIILLFILLVGRGFVIGLRARSRFEAMLAMGISFQVGLQAALNIAVVTSTVPNTGISLPFFSYGGTSLVMLLIEMGMVLAVSRNSERKTK